MCSDRPRRVKPDLDGVSIISLPSVMLKNVAPLQLDNLISNARGGGYPSPQNKRIAPAVRRCVTHLVETSELLDKIEASEGSRGLFAHCCREHKLLIERINAVLEDALQQLDDSDQKLYDAWTKEKGIVEESLLRLTLLRHAEPQPSMGDGEMFCVNVFDVVLWESMKRAADTGIDVVGFWDSNQPTKEWFRSFGSGGANKVVPQCFGFSPNARVYGTSASRWNENSELQDHERMLRNARIAPEIRLAFEAWTSEIHQQKPEEVKFPPDLQHPGNGEPLKMQTFKINKGKPEAIRPCAFCARIFGDAQGPQNLREGHAPVDSIRCAEPILWDNAIERG